MKINKCRHNKSPELCETCHIVNQDLKINNLKKTTKNGEGVMEKLVVELVKQLGEANEARWRLLTILELLKRKPELINDSDFNDEITSIIESCY